LLIVLRGNSLFRDCIRGISLVLLALAERSLVGRLLLLLAYFVFRNHFHGVFFFTWLVLANILHSDSLAVRLAFLRFERINGLVCLLNLLLEEVSLQLGYSHLPFQVFLLGFLQFLLYVRHLLQDLFNSLPSLQRLV
jgi:hypothetical protein